MERSGVAYLHFALNRPREWHKNRQALIGSCWRSEAVSACRNRGGRACDGIREVPTELSA